VLPPEEPERVELALEELLLSGAPLLVLLAGADVLEGPADEERGEDAVDVALRVELGEVVDLLPELSDFAPAPYLVEADEGPVEVAAPDLGTLEEGAPAEDEPPALAPTFSAVRSIVTGRLELLVDEEVDALPGLSVGPLPPPPEEPEEDVPPEDFLSVAIYSPPEPTGSKTFTIHASL
jgi:hypothetical protein